MQPQMSATTSADDCRALARTLVRLARAGAYARPASTTPGRYEIFSARNGFVSPLATVPDDAITAAQALGWLTMSAGDGRLALSRQGRHALKRVLCESGAPSNHGPRTARPLKSAVRAQAAHPQAPQRTEGPLLWLRNRKDRSGRPLISQAQYEAGSRLATDYATGQMQARITASWSADAPCLRTGTPGAGVDISDAALAARGRLHAALAAVGPELGQFLVDVCCHDIGLESAERARGWPVRSGKVVLDMGLTALARHYGFEAAPPAAPAASPGHRAARRWADPAFTPNLSRWERSQDPAASPGADATACP
jgi:hypothetical protein